MIEAFQAYLYQLSQVADHLVDEQLSHLSLLSVGIILQQDY